MPTMQSRGQTIYLTDRVAQINYASRASLLRLLSEPVEVPVLWGHESHPYFNLYRVNGPAVEKEAGIWVPSTSKVKVQLCWTQWPGPRDSRSPKAFPSELYGWPSEICLLAERFNPQEVYILIGTANCKEQLERWGIKNPKADELTA